MKLNLYFAALFVFFTLNSNAVERKESCRIEKIHNSIFAKAISYSNNTKCEKNEDCESGFCNANGQCGTAPEGEGCGLSGAACQWNSDCCSDSCGANGRCNAGGGSCSGAGSSCQWNSECCSDYCSSSGRCDAGGGSCIKSKNSCEWSSECCSGFCNTSNKCN